MNGEQSMGRNITIVHNDKLLATEKDKANAWNLMYSEVARKAKFGKERTIKSEIKGVKKANKLHRQSAGVTEAEQSFSLAELKTAINETKNNRAAGEDGVYNEFLKAMKELALKELLELANEIWLKGVVPNRLKLGIIVPIPKPGKNPELLESYRPVTLTSNIAKVIEKMVVRRTMHELESKELLLPNQSGFRKGRNTTDQIVRLTEAVMNGFQHKRPHKRTLTALIDFSRAFDRVNHVRLLQILREMDLPPRICAFFFAFLYDRKNMCKVGHSLSRQRKFASGVPQGTVCGPILFLCFINHLATKLSKVENLEFGFFADDLTIWNSNANPHDAGDVVQNGLNEIQKWCEWCKMKVAPEKCELILFSQYAADNRDENRRPELMINGEKLLYKEKVRLLGILLDIKLIFKYQVEKVKKEANRRLIQMRYMASTNWGCSKTDLRMMYLGYVRSVIEYGADVWGSMISQTRMKEIEIIQNQGARIITGCVNTTNIDSLLLEANLEPLKLRFEMLNVKRFERMKRLPYGDPLRKIVDEPMVQKRLQRDTWKNKILASKTEENRENKEMTLLSFPYAPWECESSKNVFCYPHLSREVPKTNTEENKQLRRQATLETLADRGDHEIKLWTDGSVSETGSAGAGLIFEAGMEEPCISIAEPAGKNVSSYRAEMVALDAGLDALLCSNLRNARSLLIATDSQSAVNALSSGPLQQTCVLNTNVWAKLLKLSKDMSISIQFVASHCGVMKNEMVDEVAGVASSFGQNRAEIPICTPINRVRKQKREEWKTRLDKMTTRYEVLEDKEWNKKDSVNMKRADECLLSQLRCGQSRLIGSYRKKLGISDGVCRWCGLADETVRHVFEDCENRLVRRLRRGVKGNGVKKLKVDPEGAVRMVRSMLEELAQ